VSRHFTFSRLIVAAVVVCASAVPASAQIYSWRDAAGNLVLSNQRPDGAQSVTSYEVPHAASVRTTRATPISRRVYEDYDDLIVEHSRRHNVRQSLVRAVIQVESAGNPWAHSPKGAMGLMQLMPATAREFGVNNAYNPEENVRAGVAYLRQLLDRYDGNEQLALAAYNAGPGAVDRHNQTIPPYRETTQYVSKISKMAGAGKPAEARTTLYRTIEIIDGQPIVKYTDKKPE
jgi:soluble lytic murein transglycosylase-like protein